MGKSVIVIGAGIAGLCAGCYAQMNGYATRIFEMHDMPGGVCTAWRRRGYTIDCCIQWLVGSNPSSRYHQLWEEVGLIQGRQIIDSEEFARVEAPDGRAVIIYTDLNRLESHLTELAPSDAPLVKELLAAARHAAEHEMPTVIPGTSTEAFRLLPRMLPLLTSMRRWSKLTVGQVCEHLESPLLKAALTATWDPGISAFALIGNLAWLHARNAGYPIGGSLPLVRAVEKRFQDLGGQVEYKSRVTRILVERDRAVGVRLADGREERADAVISAADGHATIFDLLEGRYIDETIREAYESRSVYKPLVFIGLGVARDFTREPQPISGGHLLLAEPVPIGPDRLHALHHRIHNFDPTLAPPGKTLITSIIPSEYDYWIGLAEDRPRYEAEKKAAADILIAVLDRRYPGLAAQVEMVDVSTPVTWERYTGNWRGSYEGWFPSPKNFSVTRRKTLPGLADFYMAGQWVAPSGGLPIGVATGRQVVQQMCRRDGMRFRVRV